MVADHAVKIVPEIAAQSWAWVLWSVGRAAMPLFLLAFVLQGMDRKSSGTWCAGNWLRSPLLLLAIATQPIYMAAFDYPWWSLNILFLFWALGGLTDWLRDQVPQSSSDLWRTPLSPRTAGVAALWLVLTMVLSADSSYGAWGLLCVAVLASWVTHAGWAESEHAPPNPAILLHPLSWGALASAVMAVTLAMTMTELAREGSGLARFAYLNAFLAGVSTLVCWLAVGLAMMWPLVRSARTKRTPMGRRSYWMRLLGMPWALLYPAHLVLLKGLAPLLR